ncbi:MAG: dihydrolipoyl dehydrogenase family protein [Nanoarchaeota archaeon]
MKYDVIVIGSGTGMHIVENAVNQGLKTALVDKGRAAGTCLNVGCIPSKLLIAAADRAIEIKESEKFGISSEIKNIDFERIIQYARVYIYPLTNNLHDSWKKSKDFDYYEGLGEFVSDYTLSVNGQEIKGDKIFIASGSRPKIPAIEGINETKYITNEDILNLDKLPKSLVIIGGGYIAAEYAHFFSAMGTEVTIVQKGDRMLQAEEPEVSKVVQDSLSERVKIILNKKPVKIERTDKKIVHLDDGEKIESEELLVAVGRDSNADLSKVEKTGVKTHNRGYIQTNEYLETSKKNIWAFGDANGKAMFTHAANEEASLAWHNAMVHKHSFDYSAVPHAVFSWPPIGSIGLTEVEAKMYYHVAVGKAKYNDVVKGSALREDRGFAKGIFDRETGNILGFHIVGPMAPTLIQEVANAMQADKSINLIAGMHIHPAMSELITSVLGNIS